MVASAAIVVINERSAVSMVLTHTSCKAVGAKVYSTIHFSMKSAGNFHQPAILVKERSKTHTFVRCM